MSACRFDAVDVDVDSDALPTPGSPRNLRHQEPASPRGRPAWVRTPGGVSHLSRPPVSATQVRQAGEATSRPRHAPERPGAGAPESRLHGEGSAGRRLVNRHREAALSLPRHATRRGHARGREDEEGGLNTCTLHVHTALLAFLAVLSYRNRSSPS